jgi:polar amino acid transport system substrate-binding protein
LGGNTEAQASKSQYHSFSVLKSTKEEEMLERRTAITILTFALLFATIGARADTLEQIKKRGYVTVGTEAASYPFEFVQGGKIVGYNKEILDEIIAAWQVRLDQLDVPFSGLLVGLTQKKYDFIASNLFVTQERAEKFAFTMPTASIDMALARRKGDQRVHSVDDMSGLIVGVVVPPSIPYTAYNEHNDKLKSTGKAAGEIKVFPSSPECFVALANKQIDVVALHVPGILGAMQRRPDTFEIVGKFGGRYWTGWVTRPEDTELRDSINLEIRRLRDSGKLRPLQEKWFGYAMEIPDNGYLPVGAK